jgi:hypothetical protein
MSADNGIYILETDTDNGREYRVTSAQCIESIYCDLEDGRGCDVTDSGMIEEWGDSEVFNTETKALKYAEELANTIDWLEYGICFIRVDRKFPQK